MKHNNNILFFEYSLSGHRLEYIHHQYIKALSYSDKSFVFYLPDTFNKVKHKLEWPNGDNVRIELYNSPTIKGNIIINSFKLNYQLRKAIIDNNSRHVFLNSLMTFMPMLPFMVPNKVKLYGIIYFIYLYRWKKSNFLIKFQDVIKYILFSKLRVFRKIFILNDNSSALYLNKIYKTSKFEYLPDPFVPIGEEKTKNVRKDFNIANDKTVYLHFGSMTERKGTIEIFKALEIIDESHYSKLCFIFAGKVGDDIKTVYYNKLNNLKHKVQILSFDEFCDYSFLGSLCISCDFILIPYKNTSQSSGLIGFAAQFEKPVISPSSNLLGKLVRKFRLGVTFDNLNAYKLADIIINDTALSSGKNIKSKYLSTNNINEFNDKIFRSLNISQTNEN